MLEMIRPDLSNLDMSAVSKHYKERLDASRKVQAALKAGDAVKFARCALGIGEPHTNYSAVEHNLAPQILLAAKPKQVLDLGSKILDCIGPIEMVDAIYRAKIPYLKISVGSEIAMMLKPEIFWVANTRSVWAHLLVKHGFNYKRANEELALYRDRDEDSEMAYKKWRGIYLDMRKRLIELGELGDEQAKLQKVTIGRARNLWSDALANAIYEKK